MSEASLSGVGCRDEIPQKDAIGVVVVVRPLCPGIIEARRFDVGLSVYHVRVGLAPVFVLRSSPSVAEREPEIAVARNDDRFAVIVTTIVIIRTQVVKIHLISLS